jgi:hypothetical protein
MSTTEVLVDVATFVMSVGTAMFIAGMRWGQIKADIHSIKDRISRIEGLFTLKLKKEYDDSDGLCLPRVMIPAA